MDIIYYTRECDFTAVYVLGVSPTTYILRTSFFDSVKKQIHEYIPVTCNVNWVCINPTIIDDIFPVDKKIQRISIEITDTCNLQCSHCCMFSKVKGTYLSMEKFEETLFQIKKYTPIDLKIGGGEPTMHNKIVDICQRVMEIEPFSSHTLLTNATTQSTIWKDIIKTGIPIQISLYGFYYDSFCSFTHGNHNSFDNIFSNIEAIPKKYRSNVHIIFYNVTTSQDEYSDFLNFATANGFKNSLGNFMYTGRAARNYEIEDISLYYGKNRGVQPPHLYYRLCPLNRIHIDVHGNMTPCAFFRTNMGAFGNIFRNNMSEVLGAKERQVFYSKGIDDVNGCQNCAIRYLCSGGCCAVSKTLWGTFTKKFPFCQVEKELSKIKENQIYKIDKIAPGIFDIQPIK